MSVTLWRTAGLLSLLLLVAASCATVDATVADERAPGAGGDARQTVQQAEADASAADATREDADLVVWADEARSDALRPLVEAFGDEHAVSVALQAIPFEQIRDQFQVAGPEGEGPDVIIGAHDWLGELVPGGMVAPVELGDRAAAFADVAVSAVTYDGRTYGVPYALSSVALVRNTGQVPTAPETWEDLVAAAGRLQQGGAVRAGVAAPADPYHLYPLVTALGGYLFGSDAEGGPDLSDLGIDSPGGVAAARRFRAWAEDGLIDFTESSAEAQEAFAAGDAAFAILDPASTEADGNGLPGSGIPYEVSPVPPVDGRTARPFVIVEAMMVSAFAVDAELAERFLLDYAGTGGGQAALTAATGRPPAHGSVPTAVADTPQVAGFAASARNGVALPAVPETGSVWAPWAEALERVRDGDADAQRALSGAAEEIRALIGR